MTDAELLRPHLDEAAGQLLWRRHRGPYTLKHVRDALRQALTERGFISVRVNPALDPLITKYLDEHQAFERVPGDEPLWRPRVRART